MTKETTVEKLVDKKEKEKKVREQAKKCLKDRVEISDIDGNLSKQLFDNAPTLYLNPTEGLNLQRLITPDSSFLTVLGSGDFALDAIFHGSKEIVTFDINRNQYYPAALKVKGLQNMSYKDYYNFFSFTHSEDYLSSELYEELKRTSEPNPSLYAFFDEIIKQKEIDDRKIQNVLKQMGLTPELLLMFGNAIAPNQKDGYSNIELDILLNSMNQNYQPALVYRTISGLEGLKLKDSYLESEESFETTKEEIKTAKISHLKVDLLNIRRTLELSKYKGHKFSAIYLSNIPEYIDGELFAKCVEEELMPLLESNGEIAYCCQGTDVERLMMSEEELTELKNNAGLLQSEFMNPFALYQIVNSTTGYKKLKEKYDVELQDMKSVSNINGLDTSDIYVYVKKKSK